MKKIIKFKRLKNRLTFWFFLVAMVPVIIIAWNVYLQRVASIKKEAFSKLIAIRDLKVTQLNNWLDERIGDIQSLSENPTIRATESYFNNNIQKGKESSILDNANTILASSIVNHSSYHELFIINSKTGKIVLSTDQSSIGADKLSYHYFLEPIRTGDCYIHDIYYSKTIHNPSMTFSIPLMSLTPKDGLVHIFGVLVARVDLTPSLYSLLLDRTGMGKTGETLIVNKDVIALNELRWFENAPLKLKINAKPAVLASQGNEGIIETTDYRNEKILAAYTYIPRTKWGFVSKQDLTDIYSPIYYMIRGIIILVISSIVVVFFLSKILANAIARPILDMSNVSKQIQDGDYNARITSFDDDEMGILARSINEMAESIQSNIEVQKSATSIIKSLIAKRDLNNFAVELLNKLFTSTGSLMGGFYMLNVEENKFESLYSIGMQRDSMQSFDAKSMEGQFGKVFLTKNISHIKNIPEDTVFSFKTIDGEALLKEILTIPILSENTVMAIISVASIHPYTHEDIQIIGQVLPGANSIFNNLVANEKRKQMAMELSDKNIELEAQSREMLSLNVELKAQKDELETQNIALDVQRRKVEEANRLKSEFLSNMSHELRTPLNSVMALSRVLIMQATQKLSEEESNFLHIIERNGKHLLSLINDILDLSKIESGKMDIDIKQVSIEQTLDSVVESLTPLADEKAIQIVQEKPFNLPLIESDESRIHQIFQNILGNAVKFTNNGYVSISVKNDSKNVYINVKDTGIGIPKEKLSYIFEEFRQVDGSMSRNYEGTGLGLAIALKAAKMLGGNIEAESEIGKGSTFKIVFPIKKLEQPIENETVLLPKIQPVSPQRKNILIVDDDTQTLKILSQFLTEVGYNTITTQSGKEALKIAQNTPLFAISMDVVMPEMDGWEVLQNLKKNPKTKDIPVIMISVSNDKDTGFALGAVGFINKPVQKEVLIQEIKKACRPGVKSVMIVDDNDFELKQLAEAIKEEGLKPVKANSGKECIDLLNNFVPEAIILDLMMPEMDGFQVLQEIRNNPETENIPVIISTAKDITPEDKIKLTGKVYSVLKKNDKILDDALKIIKKLLAELEAKSTYKEMTSKRLLLVEDNKTAIFQIKNFLEVENFVIDVVENGIDALNYVKYTVPDGIILDLMIPGINGFEVLEKIRNSSGKTANIPVLILTAKDLTSEDLKKLSNNNVKQLIQKGDIDKDDLLFIIKNMIGIETKKIKKPLKQIVHKQPVSNIKKVNNKEDKPTILIVEDHPDNMITIKAVLKDNYFIIEATDGEEGLNKALTEKPDLIILDISLPKMDGYSVIKNIRENKNEYHPPVIGMTAHAMKGDKERILNAGCNDYISKPIDPEYVVKIIKKWITRNENA